MKIIISPAKKMNVDNDSLVYQDLPVFLAQTEKLCSKLQSMSYDELKNLWKCNDKIATVNVERLQHMDLRKNLTPAILAFECLIMAQHLRTFSPIRKCSHCAQPCADHTLPI